MVPAEQRDVPGGEMPSTRYSVLGHLAELLIRTDAADPQRAVLDAALPHLTWSRAGRGEQPVRVGPATGKSVAEAVRQAAWSITSTLEWNFGCRRFVEMLRASFPRDIESDPWDICLVLFWPELAKSEPELADYLAPRMARRTEFLGRLFSWPLREILGSVRLEALCLWLHRNFSGIDTLGLRLRMEMEFVLAAREAGTPLRGPGVVNASRDPAPDPPARPNIFARLPGERYRIRYRNKEETMPMLVGLRVAEYLLKQPEKAAHVLKINRALCEGSPRLAPLEDAFACSEGQKGLDGFGPDASPQPDPCGKEALEEAKQAVKSLDDQAARARDGGEHDKAERMEREADTGRQWIREEEALAERKRRGQPDHDAEVEKVRVRLTNNFTNACNQLRTKYGFPELADHLEEQIDSGTEWKYNPVPGVEWVFEEAPLNPP
jgi:hypothetical protein